LNLYTKPNAINWIKKQVIEEEKRNSIQLNALNPHNLRRVFFSIYGNFNTSWMKKLRPSLQGSFHIDMSKHKGVTKASVISSLTEYIRSQYPSWHSQKGQKILFSNKVFRFKVSRGRNFIRAFNKGELQITQEDGIIYISYEGSLYRGLFIAAIQALIAFLLIIYAAPSAWWFAVLFFALGYFLQVYATHIVFPQMLGMHIHDFLTKQSK